MDDRVPIGPLLQRMPGDHGARPWRSSDASDLVAAWSDPDIIRWNGVPPDTTIAFARRWIEGTTTQHLGSAHIDVVTTNTDDQVTGELGLQINHSTSRSEVGFWVAAHARRSGVGQQLLGLAEHLLHAAGIAQGFAITASANEAAISLLQRCAWPEVATTSNDRRAFVLLRREQS